MSLLVVVSLPGVPPGSAGLTQVVHCARDVRGRLRIVSTTKTISEIRILAFFHVFPIRTREKLATTSTYEFSNEHLLHRGSLYSFSDGPVRQNRRCGKKTRTLTSQSALGGNRLLGNIRHCKMPASVPFDKLKVTHSKGNSILHIQGNWGDFCRRRDHVYHRCGINGHPRIK